MRNDVNSHHQGRSYSTSTLIWVVCTADLTTSSRNEEDPAADYVYLIRAEGQCYVCRSSRDWCDEQLEVGQITACSSHNLLASYNCGYISRS